MAAGLVGLKLAHQMGPVLTREGRRRLIRHLIDEPAAKAVRDEALSIDVRPMAEEVRRGIARLARAKQMAEVNDRVLGGTPCFKGTRIPIHDIAVMLTNGDTVAELRAAYPRLTEAQITAAPLYAQAYPRRGRRRQALPWRGRRPVSSSVIGLRRLMTEFSERRAA